MPGRHITDRQKRLFMTLKNTDTIEVAAAKAGLSRATGYGLPEPRAALEHRLRGRLEEFPDRTRELFFIAIHGQAYSSGARSWNRWKLHTETGFRVAFPFLDSGSCGPTRQISPGLSKPAFTGR